MPAPVHAAEEAFGAELTGLTTRLTTVAMKLTRNASDARDLVQETMLKAWRGRAGYEAGTNLFAWCSRILHNTWCSQWRRAQVEQRSGLGDHLALDIGPAQDWAAAGAEIGLALRAMPPDHREALLGAAQGRGYEDMAREFGCPAGTVKSRVSRARAMLREAYYPAH